MNYLLDTVLGSELVKRTPDPGVVAWVQARNEQTLFLSVVTLGELQKGISKLTDSARKAVLQSWLTHDLMQRFGKRILAVDGAVAITWGTLQGEAEQQGQKVPVLDCLIAATARVHDLAVVTRNVRDLERCGAQVINPWQPAAQ
jgi:predicted nucleic acid-binding protein